MTATEFIDAYARELGVPVPTQAQIDTLLELAGLAAHSSERIAAPLTCWIGGVSGRPVGDLLEAAKRLVAAAE